MDKESKYNHIDLGLPSGTLWATTPITNDDGEILYFQWGDTQGWTAQQVKDGEKIFSTPNDKLYSNDLYTKYNETDGKTVLDLEDDAAHVIMGGNWRIPTYEHYEELLNNTSSSWITQDGVNGRLFTSKLNGNSLFLPASCCILYGSILHINSNGYFWINSRHESATSNARYLISDSSNININYCHRCCGFCIVGVINK